MINFKSIPTKTYRTHVCKTQNKRQLWKFLDCTIKLFIPIQWRITSHKTLIFHFFLYQTIHFYNWHLFCVLQICCEECIILKVFRRWVGRNLIEKMGSQNSINLEFFIFTIFFFIIFLLRDNFQSIKIRLLTLSNIESNILDYNSL